MGIKNITEFINNLEKPELYDFKQLMYDYYMGKGIEIKDCPYMNGNDDGIAQFEAYKKADSGLKGYKRFDCDSSNDSCALTTEIYKALWDYEKESNDKIWLWKDTSRNSFYSFGGDTMNSFATTYKLWDRSEEWKDKFEEFARLTHSVGNFVLVPYGFNRWRYSQTADYWDASLNILKEEGYRKDDMRIFDKKNFNRYINYFFLWDYVKVENNEYRVDKLFMSQAFDRVKRSIPDSEELGQFVENVNMRIKSRGCFITKALKVALENPSHYKDIQKEYFCSDKVYAEEEIKEIKGKLLDNQYRTKSPTS